VGVFRCSCGCQIASCLEGDVANDNSDLFSKLGPFVFKDIVHSSTLFKTGRGPFHFNHMDMGTQNILVDHEFNFLAVIDWEFAQSAPLEVNHYPMPFPLVFSDAKIENILSNPDHAAYRNFSRQVATRELYRRKFRDAEKALEREGRLPQMSIADVLDGPVSRISAVVEKLGVFEGMDEELTYEMVRLAYGFDGEEARKYLNDMEVEMKRQ
jgi:hypothetical protein